MQTIFLSMLAALVSSQTLLGQVDSSLANYVYTVPKQWAQQQSRDRIVLTSPTYPMQGPSAGRTTENCQLTMLSWRPAGRSLGEDAIGTFRELFRADPLNGTYPSAPAMLTIGVSPQGWEYFKIKKLVGGQEGEPRTTGVTLLLAKNADQVATIVGTSKGFDFSSCFGPLYGDAWPGFFYSLQLRNARATAQVQAAIRQLLNGDWKLAASKNGMVYSFQANGRYTSAGRGTGASGQEVTLFVKMGGYSVDGNTLVLTGDDSQRTVRFFHVARTSMDGGQSWRDELCLMEAGSNGEVCYWKQ